MLSGESWSRDPRASDFVEWFVESPAAIGGRC